MCKFKIDKITYSNRCLEQHMALAKIGLQCILNVFTRSRILEVFIKESTNLQHSKPFVMGKG